MDEQFFNRDITKFLKILRESADIQYKIFTQGSCYRLYTILSEIVECKPYWSDVDNHCIVKIGDKFYDIGGEVSPNYIVAKGYYLVPQSQRKGFELLKYGEDTIAVVTEKYVEDENNK